MKKLDESTKVTLTFGQLKRLVNESMNEVDEPNVPDIDYDHPNSEDCTKLIVFLRKSGLMPKTKVGHEREVNGHWNVGIGPISHHEDGYILCYDWGDEIGGHSDEYLYFLKDGISNNYFLPLYHYTFEENPKIIAELDKIVDVFGKSKKWKNEED